MMDEAQIDAFVALRVEIIKEALKGSPDSLESNIDAHDISDEIKQRIRDGVTKVDKKEKNKA